MIRTIVYVAIIICLISTVAIAAGPELLINPRTDNFTMVTTSELVPGQAVIEFEADASPSEIDDLVASSGSKKIYESRYKPIKIIQIPAGTTLDDISSRYKRNPKVKDVRPNYIVKALMTPNDPFYSYQWHFFNSTYGGINMPAAWDKSRGQGVIVAVVDTGVAFENFTNKYAIAPDLVNTNFVPGWDFVNNDGHPNDDEGHGTHVTGTIAQTTNNNLGVAGIAFNTSIMPVKVLNQNGSGTATQVGDGIRFAADNGARVINLSLGSSVADPYIESSCQYAYDLGVTIVAASGNDGASTIIYPAAFDNYVIAVGATRYDEQKAFYSNSGTSLDITAPGGDLNVDQNADGFGDGVLQQTFAAHQPKNFGYYFYQGTSMATPHVSGVAALILSRNPSFTPNQVRNFLQSTAEDHAPSGWDSNYGWGIVDADAAVPNLSISITSDGIVELGDVSLGATTSTTPGSQEVVSVDVGPANLSIRSTDFSDGTNNWILASASSEERVKWEYSGDNSVWNTFLESGITYPLLSNVPGGGQQPLYFRLTMPTSTASNNQHGSNVTILATPP